MQGLKSGTMPDLRRAVFGCEKKVGPTFNLLITCSSSSNNSKRNAAFTLNQTNITSQSEVAAPINTRREIVSRAAALMNGEEAWVSSATR